MRQKIFCFRMLLTLFFTFIFATMTTPVMAEIFEYHKPSTSKKVHKPEEILVKFKAEAKTSDIEKLNARYKVKTLKKLSSTKVNRLKLPKGAKVKDYVEMYMKKSNLVEYAEPNYYAYAFMTPNDTYYSYQWHLYNPVNGGIHMESAWEMQPGGSNTVVVAVIDTGVAYEDYGNYRQAPDLANTNFVSGYDFVNNDTHPNDDHSHGTHVTGTIAQSTNNSNGCAGVAFNTAIMPVKVLDQDGTGTYAEIADGIRWAADNGADVINLSLGSPYPSFTLENALGYAYNNGVTIVAAAGNDSGQVSYPAAYDNYVIAVGATGFDETLAPYSNYGSSLDLVAPGGNMDVDKNSDGYGDGVLQNTFNPNTKDTSDFGYWFFQGTSMAAPHVSGVAALLIANNNAISPDEIRSALQETAKDLGLPGKDDTYGYGLVNAYEALNWTVDTNEPPIASFTYNCNELMCEFDASGSHDPDGNITSYEWDFGDGTTASGMNPINTYSMAGSYTVTLTVTDNQETFGIYSQDVIVGEQAFNIHIGDLDAVSSKLGQIWQATVTITVHDNLENPVQGADVEILWSDGSIDWCWQLTDANGQCTAIGYQWRWNKWLGLTVTNVYATPPYQANNNHDPDGDSDGTQIWVHR